MEATSGGRQHARSSESALDSTFRRRWTWRTRVRVTVLGYLGAIVLRLLYLTLRVRWTDPAGVFERRARGERFVYATWHDGLLLLPLAALRLPGPIRPQVLISWHRDAEIGAQAGRWFGVHFTRGSTTRGGIGAVRGLLAAHRAGEDVVIVADGPRGPRHRTKPGIVLLARATRVAVVPVVVGAASCRRLRSWDRLQVPFPFSRVAIHLGAPVDVGEGVADAEARVQAALDGAVAALGGAS